MSLRQHHKITLVQRGALRVHHRIRPRGTIRGAGFFDDFISGFGSVMSAVGPELLKILPQVLPLIIGGKVKKSRARKVKGESLNNFGSSLHNFGGNVDLDKGLSMLRKKVNSGVKL